VGHFLNGRHARITHFALVVRTHDCGRISIWADRRSPSFSNDMLAHPLVVFFASAAAALLVLRVALARPVPELIPERPLIAGCILGAAAFLVGNFVTTRLLG
jgi:hypothetical protein